LQHRNFNDGDKASSAKVQPSFDDVDTGRVTPGRANGTGKGNGTTRQASGSPQDEAGRLDGRDQDQGAQDQNGTLRTPVGRDNAAGDGGDDGLPDLVTRQKPFDATSFAAADAAQGLAGDGVQFTVIENVDGRLLTKSFSASADGRTIDAWEAARNSSSARAIRAGLDPDPTREIFSLQAKVRSLKPNQCLITAPLPGTARTRQVIFKDQWDALPPGERDLASDGPLYRGTTCFAYPPGQPAIFELDVDTKDWPDAIRDKQHQAGGLLRHVLPVIDRQFASAGCYARPSCSAGVRDTRTKKMLPTGAKHVSFVAKDGADIPRGCAVAFQRLVLSGYGFIKVYKDGTTKLSSPIDPDASGRPERLWYDAAPVLLAGRHGAHLELVASLRKELPRPGPRFDTRTLKDLNDAEKADYARIVAELEAVAKPHADQVREAYVAARVARGVAAGLSQVAARRQADAAADGGRLDVDGEYRFDEGTWRSGWDILAAVEVVAGQTGADPLEPDYGGGNNRAIWYRSHGEPGVCCHSHAHGKRVFHLAYDAADWIALFDRLSGSVAERLAALRAAGRHYLPVDATQAHQLLRQAGVPSPVVLDFVEPDELSRTALLAALQAEDWSRLAWLSGLGPLLRTELAALRQEDELVGLGFAVDWDQMDAKLDAPAATLATAANNDPAYRGPLDDRPEVDALIRELNRCFFVLNDGRAAIVEQDTDEAGNPRYRYHSPPTFKNLHSNRLVTVATDKTGKETKVKAGEVWFSHPRRRQYLGGEVFDPQNRHRPDQFNRWQGWGVQPVRGDWSRMRAHIREVIAGDDPVVDTYVIKWCARMVQRPWEVGEVVLMLRSLEGAGKGTFGQVLMQIAGAHGIYLGSEDHLVGAFNDHLFGRVFVFADEGVFAGDKAGVNKLKSLATEPGQSYNGKNRPLFSGRNAAHILAASNNLWVIPAGLDSRRWCVLDVSGARIGDRAWFEGIHAELVNGGAAAMLYDLLHMDLSGFDVRDYPVTDALIDQRDISLDTDLAWLKDCLSRGYVWASVCGQETHFNEWHPEMSTDVLYRSYEKYARSRQARRIHSREAFGRFLASTGASLKRLTDAVIGERGSGFSGQLVMAPRPNGYVLGDLAAARADFTRRTGIPV
jgi:hypothetical protein